MQENDPVKNFLRSAYNAKLEIRRLQGTIQDLQDNLERVTPMYSDMPGGGGMNDGDGQRKQLAALIDLKRMLQEQMLAYSEGYKAVDQFINELPNCNGRMLLKLRYLDCKSFGQITRWFSENGCNYSERQIYRFHGSALRLARAKWNEQYK